MLCLYFITIFGLCILKIGLAFQFRLTLNSWPSCSVGSVLGSYLCTVKPTTYVLSLQLEGLWCQQLAGFLDKSLKSSLIVLELTELAFQESWGDSHSSWELCLQETCSVHRWQASRQDRVPVRSCPVCKPRLVITTTLEFRLLSTVNVWTRPHDMVFQNVHTLEPCN